MSVSSANSTSNQKTIQQIIDQSSSTTGSRNTGSLGKDDFMNLLVTQLRYQDPLNPTDDKEFIGQMAQFSALEQMQNLNTSFTATKAFSLIGKTVDGSITNSDNESQEISGTVTNVKLTSGKYYVVVNGTDVPIDNITGVTDSALTSGDLSSYTSLIGHDVTGIAYDSSTGDMLQVNGNVQSIAKGQYEDYAILNGVQVTIAGLNTDEKSTDPNFVINSLNDALKNGTPISVYIKDATTGKKVPVTVKITKLDTSSGSIKATVDGLSVPVEGITNVTGSGTGSTAGQAGA